MKHKLTLILCVVIMLCAAGCQLARTDTGDTAEDKFIGIFITTEYLDLFDFEGYLTDNLRGFRGGEITVDGNAKEYQGRLYAALTAKTLTNEETGERIETEEYVFEDIEGISYFSALMSPAESEGNSYHSGISDGAISDGHMAIAHTGEEYSVTMTGTIYVVPSNMRNTYYFNPVYQDKDGGVYAVSGSGFTVMQETYGEGSVYSQTLTSETVVTENGESKTERTSVTISINSVFATEKIIVLQMDTDNNLISRTEYLPGKTPDVIVPQTDTAYLIVESYKRGNEGEFEISRELYDDKTQNFETFFPRPDGICQKRPTEIKW